jgi:CheY-like chemotaxis protein
MGGKIEVTSQPDKGSCFTFTLPCPVLATQSPAASITSVQAAFHSRVPGSTLRILMAEDNPVNRKVACGLIERQGHSVTCVEDGLQAVEELQKNSYDLVLMDLQMPRMGGLEATSCIRQVESLRSLKPIPIIALTAHAMKGDEERCLKAGMNDYLPKPIRLDDLTAKLSKWCNSVVLEV